MTRYAWLIDAATIAPAFDASKTYVRMPTSNATTAPRSTGTWCVGVCARSRHDCVNPAPDFVRVASIVLSPPWPRPPVRGDIPVGTTCEPRVRPDKDDVTPAGTKATTSPHRPARLRVVHRHHYQKSKYASRSKIGR